MHQPKLKHFARTVTVAVAAFAATVSAGFLATTTTVHAAAPMAWMPVNCSNVK